MLVKKSLNCRTFIPAQGENKVFGADVFMTERSRLVRGSFCNRFEMNEVNSIAPVPFRQTFQFHFRVALKACEIDSASFERHDTNFSFPSKHGPQNQQSGELSMHTAIKGARHGILNESPRRISEVVFAQPFAADRILDLDCRLIHVRRYWQ